MLQKTFTQTPQPLKSGWSQIVKQQTRGTVSAPTSPSKRQPSAPLSSSRRETAASNLGRPDWTESAAPMTASESSKPRGDPQFSAALAANTGRKEVHALSSEPAGDREPQAQSLQSSAKGQIQSHEGQEVETTLPASASIVREAAEKMKCWCCCINNCI